MKRIDLSGFLFLTTTYPGRYSLLMATISNVMSAVTNATFKVQHYGDYEATNPFGYLELLAQATGNKLTVAHVDPAISVATTKKMVDTKFDYFVNLDDDLIIPHHAWTHVTRWDMDCWPQVITFGVVDADGSRGYADYTQRVFEGINEYMHTEGMAYDKAKHHLFSSIQVLRNYRALTQLYILPYELWNHTAIWDDILTKFNVKGVRGYDVRLEELLNTHGIPITLFTGCEAIHMGMESPFIGGQWTGDHYAK